MKKVKVGLLCLAVTVLGSQAMAMAGKPFDAATLRNENISPRIVSVPESGSLAMLAAGVIGIGVMRRFKK
jgi:hypothetical protein